MTHALLIYIQPTLAWSTIWGDKPEGVSGWWNKYQTSYFSPSKSSWSMTDQMTSGVSQPPHYWHIGPKNSLLWKVVLCTVGCLAVSWPLPDRCQCLLTPCDNQNISRYCQLSPMGQNHPRLRTNEEDSRGLHSLLSSCIDLDLGLFCFISSQPHVTLLGVKTSLPLIIYHGILLDSILDLPADAFVPDGTLSPQHLTSPYIRDLSSAWTSLICVSVRSACNIKGRLYNPQGRKLSHFWWPQF